METKFINTKEAAKILGMKPATLYKRTSPNTKLKIKEKPDYRPIPFYKPGGILMFCPLELESYVRGHKVIQMDLPKDDFSKLKLPTLLAA
jgi:hypothetical protein